MHSLTNLAVCIYVQMYRCIHYLVVVFHQDDPNCKPLRKLKACYFDEFDAEYTHRGGTL